MPGYGVSGAYLEPEDEGGEASVGLEGLHVKVCNQVHHAHRPRHKLQPGQTVHVNSTPQPDAT